MKMKNSQLDFLTLLKQLNIEWNNLAIIKMI